MSDQFRHLVSKSSSFSPWTDSFFVHLPASSPFLRLPRQTTEYTLNVLPWRVTITNTIIGTLEGGKGKIEDRSQYHL